uniref:Peptidase S1 domain-containing protein n=1 Tax=Electrophorus electricus TaxID=8005 RepID=A0A4W4FCC8_ELEEL
MYNNLSHINHGFQDEESRPLPQAPSWGSVGVYPTVPQYAFSQPMPINTHHTATAGHPHPISAHRGTRKSRCPCITVALIVVLIILGVAAVLVWYFVFEKCMLGFMCGDSRTCLSSSNWCDGHHDCPGGEDKATCFRLYGSNFLLQSFSSKDQTWKPMCSDRWDNNIGKTICEHIGYSRLCLFESEIVTTGNYIFFFLNLQCFPLIFGFSSAFRFRFSLCCALDCGRSGDGTRIVGGQTVTTRGRWPWQVSLHVAGSHQCGGSIITPSWIITAAHCVQTLSLPSQWTVYAGYLTLTEMYAASGSPVSRIIYHPGFDSKTNNNDIALMKLLTPLKMSTNVGPVCLPNAGVNFAAPRQCSITGWGAVRSGGPASEQLQEATVSLIDRSICNSRQVYNGHITDNMICAGKLEGGVDSCQGDSGGPLVIKETSLWWLIGDTSWGEGCAFRNKPGVYGNVTYFLKWIYEQMQV